MKIKPDGKKCEAKFSNFRLLTAAGYIVLFRRKKDWVNLIVEKPFVFLESPLLCYRMEKDDGCDCMSSQNLKMSSKIEKVKENDAGDSAIQIKEVLKTIMRVAGQPEICQRSAQYR